MRTQIISTVTRQLPEAASKYEVLWEDLAYLVKEHLLNKYGVVVHGDLVAATDLKAYLGPDRVFTPAAPPETGYVAQRFAEVGQPACCGTSGDGRVVRFTFEGTMAPVDAEPAVMRPMTTKPRAAVKRRR